MRVDRLTIGTPGPHPTHQFRNLKDVSIDFDQDHWVTVVIGWNGTGKSNVLEALAIIFRDLITEKRTPLFAYRLEYSMGTGAAARRFRIDADPERKKEPYIVHAASSEFDASDASLSESEGKWTKLKLSEFFSGREKNLPRYVFSYYSGEGRRMEEVFRPYLEGYDSKLRRGEDPGPKRLFFAMPVHSQFVLLAFLTRPDAAVREVLEDHLGLDPKEGLESVLFVLREPPWKAKAEDGDPRFWNARGVVSSFLARLYEVAVAPIEVSRRVRVSMWNDKTLQFKYLFIKDIAALRTLVGKQLPAEFFRDLESTHVSELIEEVRIRVRLRKNDGAVTFRDLSEGEQQLLTVLGLLRFTAEKESLFLLDEPDTHLNPRWTVDYLGYLRKFVGSSAGIEDNSHIILTTHNPLAIAELAKEQVQILHFRSDGGVRSVVACHPEMDPRGLGYAAIVSSDMFGIASSLDTPTQRLLEEQRALSAKDELTGPEQAQLETVNGKLDRLGFRFFLPDDEYSRYLRLRNRYLAERFKEADPTKLAERAVAMSREAKEDLAARLIRDLANEDERPRR